VTAKTRSRKTAAWRDYAAGSELDHFAKFCREHLVQSIDEWAGKPLKLEPFERRMFGEALAYDEKGWPVWRSVVIVLPRKNGKTICLAAYALYRLLTSDGSPEILFAAASDKQAGRLFDYTASFVRSSPVLSELLRVRDYVGEIVREDGGGQILRMASDPGKLHGYNPNLVVCDELAQWVTPSLRRAFAALTTGGGARSAPQVFTITVAGEASHRHDSILGRILDAAEQGAPEREPGLTIGRLHEASTLVYNFEAPTTDPLDVAAMKLANPASWITKDYLARQAADPELTTADVLQLHGCVWAEAESTFLGPDAISGARDPRRLLQDDEQVVLGFDGSERRDETWLTACTLDGFVQPLARWARPRGAPDDWRIPRGEVHEAVEAAFERFDVLELAGDPPGWYSELDLWSDLYGEERVLAFETKQAKRMAPACERTQLAVQEGGLRFGGPLTDILAMHFGNCVRRETPFGTVVTKDHKDSPRKIDGAVTAIIGYERAMWHAGNSAEPPKLLMGFA
jgi:phage terminase large subunit-like protein